jgi:hypothetical protein
MVSLFVTSNNIKNEIRLLPLSRFFSSFNGTPFKHPNPLPPCVIVSPMCSLVSIDILSIAPWHHWSNFSLSVYPAP